MPNEPRVVALHAICVKKAKTMRMKNEMSIEYEWLYKKEKGKTGLRGKNDRWCKAINYMGELSAKSIQLRRVLRYRYIQQFI